MASTTAEQTRSYMLVFYVGLYCIYWHDWLTTLHLEYKRIWKAKWSVVKALYIVTRYAPLVHSIFILQGFNVDFTESQCRRYLAGWANALPLLVQATVSGIVMIRCYAIWNRNKYILAFFLALQAAQSACGAWLVATYIDVVSFPEGHGPCIYFISRPTMTVGCILSAIFDFTATGLLVYRAFQIRCHVAGGLKSDILSLILRHGALYAFGIGVSVVANLTFGALSMHYDTAFRGYPGSNFCTVIAAMLACRLVLSLRDASEAESWSSGANTTASLSAGSPSTSSGANHSERTSRTKVALAGILGGGHGVRSSKHSRSGTKSFNEMTSKSSSNGGNGGVQISKQTVKAYCSDSSGTVHLAALPDSVDALDGSYNGYLTSEEEAEKEARACVVELQDLSGYAAEQENEKDGVKREGYAIAEGHGRDLEKGDL